MTALNRTPSNLNSLQTDGFEFVVERLPNIRFFAQELNIPGFSSQVTYQPNPFNKIPVLGDHVDWEDLIVDFEIDEDLKNFTEIYDWINQTNYTENYEQYAELAKQPPMSNRGLMSEISVLVNTNLKNANIQFTFRQAFPYAIRGFSLSTTETGIAKASAVFKYEKYVISVIPRA